MADARLVPLRWEELSALQHEVYELPRTGASAVLVVEYRGAFGEGSSGRDDARYIEATASAAALAWPHAGLILDFSQLSYGFGDEMASVFALGYGADGRPRPFAVVTGPDCRAGLESLQEGEEPSFLASDLDAALALL